MKKKIAIITNVPSPYRVDFFYYLQTHYEDYEFSIIYYCNDNMSRQWKADEDRILNSYYVPSKTIRIKKRFDDHFISFPVGVGRLLTKLAPDAVVAMEYSPAILQAMHWCQKHKIPYVSWTDGTINSEKNIGRLQKLSRRYIFKRADAFIGSSHAAMENQLRYGALKEHCHISMLTVDLDKYYINDRNGYPDKLLYVGSLIERKGVDLLFNALAQCNNTNITLVIVGDGKEKENLIKLAKQLGIIDRIDFRGFLAGDELRQCYRDAGAFVLPTREDCFGLVLVEAMCAGLAIIASKYSDGAAETVTDGKNGYIVDPYDAKEFARAIDAVFAVDDTAQARQQLGAASFKATDKFRFENVALGYLDAIEDALGAKGCRKH